MSVIHNTALYFRRFGLLGTLWRIQLEMRRRILRPQMARLVELMGNRWTLDGCTFLLDSPLIPRYTKCTFVSRKYERDMRSLVKAHLHPDRPTIELGGSIGVVSCITNRLLDDPRRHVVVEANPELLHLLEANKRENDCQFSVTHAAIAYGAASVPFFIHEKATGGSVHFKTDRSVTVPTITLQRLLKDSVFTRINFIVDIEGAEIPLIAHEADVLSAHVQTLFIEMHPATGKDLVPNRPTPQDVVSSAALQTLRDKGFVLLDQRDTVYVFEHTA